MEIVRQLLLVLHIIGIASLLGGFLLQMKAMGAKEAKVVPAILHGALTMLVTGVLLTGVVEMGDDPVNHAKIGIKLVVLVAILGLAFGFRKKDPVSSGVLGAIGGLTVVNIVLAVMWT